MITLPTKHTKIVAISTASMFVLTIGYFSIRARKRDERSAAFLQGITAHLKQSDDSFQVEGAFDPKYVDRVVQQVRDTIISLKKEAALDYASQLHSAWKPWYLGGDDEALAYSVFRQLKDKVQLAQLAAAYQQSYQQSLIETLKERLDKKEINTIMGIIQPLPPYRTP